MAAMLALVEKEGLPTLHNRNQIRQSRDEMCDTPTPSFGPLIQTINMVDVQDKIRQVSVANPLAYLWTALTTSDTFAAHFKQCLADNPCTPESPWSIVLYSDEVTPGNVLAAKNTRKYQSVTWTFKEPGSYALSREEAWFPLITLFSSIVRELNAGMSQLFSRVIEHFFSRDGFNLATGGIRLPSGERLWAKLCCFIQDGDAHVQTFCIRGSRGSNVLPSLQQCIYRSKQNRE